MDSNNYNNNRRQPPPALDDKGQQQQQRKRSNTQPVQQRPQSGFIQAHPVGSLRPPPSQYAPGPYPQLQQYHPASGGPLSAGSSAHHFNLDPSASSFNPRGSISQQQQPQQPSHIDQFSGSLQRLSINPPTNSDIHHRQPSHPQSGPNSASILSPRAGQFMPSGKPPSAFHPPSSAAPSAAAGGGRAAGYLAPGSGSRQVPPPIATTSTSGSSLARQPQRIVGSASSQAGSRQPPSQPNMQSIWQSNYSSSRSPHQPPVAASPAGSYSYSSIGPAPGFMSEVPQSAVEPRFNSMPYGSSSGGGYEGENWNTRSPASAIGSYGLFSGRAPMPIGPSSDADLSGGSVPRTPVTPLTSAKYTPTTTSNSLNKMDHAFPARPDYGVRGRKIKVRANFFEFMTIPGQNLYHYDIKITPEVPPSLNRKIFRELIIQYSEAELSSALPVFDGRRNIYSPVMIKAVEEKAVLELEVTLMDQTTPKSSEASMDTNVTPKPQPPRIFQVRIKACPLINMDSLKTFVASSIPSQSPPFDAMMALDIIMRHRPSMLLTTVGRSFFTRNDVKSLGDGAECWMGFHQSVRPAQNKVVINIDVSATAFFEPGPLIRFIARNIGRKNLDDLGGPLRPRELEKCERLLKGVKVQVNHRGDIHRKYKINGLSRTPADQTFFKFTKTVLDPVTGERTPTGDSEEEEISVADYFLKQYNSALRFPYLPCLRVGNPARTVYLPIEVCDIVQGQRFLRKLNESQTAQMIRLTCQTPDRRAGKIANSINELGIGAMGGKIGETHIPSIEVSNDPEDEVYLNSFGVRINNEMMTIPARVIDPPTVQYHPSSREPLITPREGSWNLRDKKVVQPATLHSWVMVCFGSPREMPQHKMDHFLRELIHTCRDTGLAITNLHPPAIYGDPTNNIEGTLQAAWQAAGEATHSFPQLILCVLPNTGVSLYAEIKRVGDTVLGVPTQCVQVKHTFQPKKQYCANVCLKINAKLGGVNSFIVKNPHNVNDPGLPWVGEAPTIIFGADVTHPAHGESRNTGSVCALVGSLDRMASRYAATVRLQPPRREIILDLSSMVQELLNIFYAENGQVAPQRIFFYRDGISESQFIEVVSSEIQAIREACERIQAGYRPTITYVVVQKRHHARLFTTNPKDADRSGNVPAGTVIDSHITHPNEYDFYLCSHAGLQGTSRPTHYHVLHDENNLTPDTLQDLTYRLCYGYARCTRSVSVVPPAYYADLVAFRAKYHLKSGLSSFNAGNMSAREESSVASGSIAGDGQDNVRSSDDESDGAGRFRRRKQNTQEEELELSKKFHARLAKVKPDLQRVMYFM